MRAQNLQIGYGEKKVGPLYNLELPKSKFIVILGENGVGKSSLIRTLAGMQSPLRGEILLNGLPIETYSVKQRAQEIGLILTTPIPSNQFTVKDFVAMGRYPYTNWINQLNDEDQVAIENALREISALHLTNRRFSTLSDGEQQKVQIAKVLAQSCPIIFLDEPTAHLDMHHKIQLFHLLKRQVLKEQKTVIMTSHEVNMALQMADQLLLIKSDEYHFGSTEELISNGSLSNIFDSQYLRFDEKAKQFFLNNI